jgi:tyrosyl-tRNA synthetase
MQRGYGQDAQVVLTTPILEGWRAGAEKMSKSLDNAIGIKEAPLEMYGKLMAVSDDKMWKYYELLTDLSANEIGNMKWEAHPMQAKKDLARRIVTDFHSADSAAKAAEDWAKQFQKDEVPEGVTRAEVRITPEIAKEWGNSPEPQATTDAANVKFDRVYVSDSEPDTFSMSFFDVDFRSRRNDPSAKGLFAAAIRTDKLLLQAGLVASGKEAERKRKEKAVRINGEIVSAPQIVKFVPGELMVSVGRKLKRVTITL